MIWIFLLSLVFFASDLGHSDAFIDESFYSVAHEYGNVFYLTGEAYLWPVLSSAAHDLGGLPAARLLSSILCALATTFAFKITETLTDGPVGPAATALLFAISPPATFIGTLAGYDALATMLYSLGLWQLSRTDSPYRRVSLVIAALVLVLAAATRYMFIVYVPVAVLLGSLRARDRTEFGSFFVAPLCGLGLLYFGINHAHIMASIGHARGLGVAGLRQTPLDLFGWYFPTLGWFGPLALVVMAWATWTLITRPSERRKSIGALMLAGATLLTPAYHVYVQNDFGMIRNLTLTALFGSILAGVVFDRESLRDLARPIRAALLLAVSGYLVLSQLTVAAHRHWPSWTPVIDAARRHGLDDAEIWSTASSGAVGNVWQLRSELSSHVDSSSPWSASDAMGIIRAAASREIPAVIGPLPSETLDRGDRIEGYEVVDVVPVENGPITYILLYRGRG